MYRAYIELKNEARLHARPASLFVREAVEALKDLVDNSFGE